MGTAMRLRKLFKFGCESLTLMVAYCAAFILRFEESIPAQMLEVLYVTSPLVILLQYLCLRWFRIPQVAWRYFSLADAKQTTYALVLANAVLAFYVWNIDLLMRVVPGDHFESIPRSVILIDLVLSLGGVIGLRGVLRMWIERSTRKKYGDNPTIKAPTILIGAGSVGAEAVKEIVGHPELGIEIVGFLDDDRNKVGSIIQGIRVLGQVSDAAKIAKQFGAKQAVITIGKTSGENVRRILDVCKEAAITAKIVPAMRFILDGKVNLSTVRKVMIEDLLSRDSISLDCRAICANTISRVLLITGAGGSIGSELCRTVCRFGATTLILVEQAENNLFHIHGELTRNFPNVNVIPYVADICDFARMQSIMAAHRPDVLFHAAAHKHVPMMECNPGEAIKNNVFGTRMICDLAHHYGASEMVMISTDKAVNPTSVMGVSKRIAELYLQALSQRSRTRFVAVRFGNVLGSNGSVIPTFQQQIAEGGPLTITHPDMTRYFMTIPEACELVLQAATMGQRGEIFILDMGRPVKIVDLANDLIRLSGLSPEDIEIRFTGLRPGEKLFEELALQEETAQKTEHSKIFIGLMARVNWHEIKRHLRELRELVDSGDTARILYKLKSIVPEYKVPSHLAQPLTREQPAPATLKKAA